MKMRTPVTIILMMICLTVKGTEQRPDILIYNNDTININKFPLELLIKNDTIIANRLYDSTCLSTDCWRQYVGIWKIENDSLFLIGLKSCCNKIIPFEKVFEAGCSNHKIFAGWYTDIISNGFGRILGFREEEWQIKYEKNIELSFDKGRIIKLTVIKTE